MPEVVDVSRGITYWGDREPSPADYAGLRVEVIHIDALRRLHEHGHLSAEAELVLTRLDWLQAQGVPMVEIPSEADLSSFCIYETQGIPVILGGVMKDACVYTRALNILSGIPIIDEAITAVDF